MYQNNINILTICTSLDWLVFILSLVITILAIFYGNKLKPKIYEDKNKANYVHNQGNSINAYPQHNQRLLDYLIMGRQLTLPFFIATLVSTWYGGIFGVTQIAFEHGVYNFVTQGLFWYLSYFLFALFFVKKIRSYQAITLPELVKKMYGEKSAKLAAIFIFFKTIPLTMAISVGIFLQMLLPINFATAVIIGVLFVAIYSYFGGLRAIVFSDFVQFFLMYLGVISVIVFSIIEFGGINYLTTNLPPKYFTFNSDFSISYTLVWLFIACSTTFINPTFYQRCFAAKNDKVAIRGILISIAIWFLFDLCTTMGGMYAKATIPLADPANGYLTYSLQLLPNGFRGLLLASILATILSTLDSFLFLASNVIFHDLNIFKIKHFNLKHILAITITAIITIVLTLCFGNKIEIIWRTIKGYFSACLIIPFLGGYVIDKLVTRNKSNKNLQLVFANYNKDKIFLNMSILSFVCITIWDYFKLEQYIAIDSFYIGNIVAILFLLVFYVKLQTGSFYRQKAISN